MDIPFKSSKDQQILDITDSVKKAVSDSGIEEGICNVFVPHATAAITINENADPNVCLDILDALDDVIPSGKWRHDRVDNNASAHIKASIVGPSENIPIRDGELQLGTWQDIFLCDFDGPRDRRVIVTILKS